MTPDSPARLTPMHVGMLFHSLSSPHSGVNIEQLVLDLDEAVDAPALKGAWIHVAGRHEALRTAFDWENVEAPVQSFVRRGHSPTLPLPKPWREYLRWREQLDTRASEAFWRAEFVDQPCMTS